MNLMSHSEDLRYAVYLDESDEPVFFSELKDADLYARLNAGLIIDMLTYEVVNKYVERWDWIWYLLMMMFMI